MRAADLHREWPLAANVLTTGLFLAFGGTWLGDLSHPAWFGLMLGWLFVVILVSAFAVVRHAEAVAARLGEPRLARREAPVVRDHPAVGDFPDVRGKAVDEEAVV